MLLKKSLAVMDVDSFSLPLVIAADPAREVR
jgi:hypothetical protein